MSEVIVSRFQSLAIRRFAVVFTGATPRRDDPANWDGGTIPWINSGAVNQRRIVRHSSLITKRGFQSSSTKWIPAGSVVIAMAGQGKTKGMAATVERPMTGNQSLAALIVNRRIMDYRYLAFALEPEYRNLRGVVGNEERSGLSLQDIRSFKIPVPSLEEQGLIVRYLDHAELRIAKAIAAKQRVLALLQEQKLAKFETAVFGVADEDYSEAASSHPWMGDIPNHWKVVRAKSILKLLSRPVDLLSETVTCFRDGTVTKRSNRGKIGFTESIYFSGYQGVEPGDLVVHQMDAFAGAIGVSDSAGKCTPVYAVCEVDASARPEFIAILLKLMARRGWVTALSRGIRVRSTDFRFPVLATQYLPLPPLEEQDAILDSLAKATADITGAITAVSAEIALLKEYRTRLISDVVTGKLDVRDEAAKLPEIDPMELATVSLGENGDDEEATDDD
jgi:type I restriction enzyme S subunit